MPIRECEDRIGDPFNESLVVNAPPTLREGICTSRTLIESGIPFLMVWAVGQAY